MIRDEDGGLNGVMIGYDRICWGSGGLHESTE